MFLNVQFFLERMDSVEGFCYDVECFFCRNNRYVPILTRWLLIGFCLNRLSQGYPRTPPYGFLREALVQRKACIRTDEKLLFCLSKGFVEGFLSFLILFIVKGLLSFF